MADILIISHSSEIAGGTKALVEQMAKDVTIHASGGVDGGIGTNIDQISEMLGSIDNDTICFYDIGSSLMNLEMAVEMYDGPHSVHISNAPLVEGSFLAGVESSVGTNTESILEKLNEMKK
ncbi:MAG TPA: PTS-dependent dihydroxyacetone kinase phosphotransferase subunit DhaM [Candidatus Salinicoccus stercoripullorum]|uniref:phosphoenolpyruvate--glycerone phosphotransferase n=1 Tax=Candidatus Salinicoccus stercoripullorum TaxID=2838756 RepID=A0A9D1TYK7_9STAP|nr:PTS-dependent dihydroxyacetone kinase phosphotransferase subunit DhaM [Candidatus Salinicoccus stercoripullorum]